LRTLDRRLELIFVDGGDAQRRDFLIAAQASIAGGLRSGTCRDIRTSF